MEEHSLIKRTDWLLTDHQRLHGDHDTLFSKVQYLIDWAYQHGFLYGEHAFMFPDGDVWEVYNRDEEDE